MQEAVDGVLVPFFRAYGEAFDRFQKSVSVSSPCMAEAWLKEKQQPTVQAFLMLVAQSEAGTAAGQGPGSSGASSEVLSAKMEALE